MLDILMKAIRPEAGLGHVADILQSIVRLIDHLGINYIKDGNARDAALDALIQILQSEKTTGK